jgi:hypothetical protein
MKTMGIIKQNKQSNLHLIEVVMKTKITIVLIILFSLNIKSYSQSGASLGIGGYTAPSRGVEAVFWNPANLAFVEKDQPKFQMILFSVAAGIGNNSFSFNSLTKYIGDGESIYLTEQDKNDILQKIADDGLKFDATGKISLLSFSVKNFGFGIESKVYGDISVPKDVYQNILFKLGHETYDYSVAGGGFGVTKFKLSYGKTFLKNVVFEAPFLRNTVFKEISAGISLSYLLGTGFAEIENGSAQLAISESGILPHVNYKAKVATMGSGMGVDIGFGAHTRDHWKIGVIFENVIANINWNRDTEMATYSADFGNDPLFILGAGQLSEIEMDEISTDTTLSIASFSKTVPFNFRTGIAKEIGQYLINFELANENKKFSTALGGRIKFGFFNYYAAIGRMMGNFHWNTAFALDFKNFYFDLGVSSRGGLTLGYAKALFLGTSMRFGF